MSRTVFLFDPPTRFVVGTVGEPGERSFYLQARDDTQLVSVLIEKEQAELLAEKVIELLDEVEVRHPEIPDLSLPPAAEDVDPLETPIEPDFRAGSLGLGWNSLTNRVIVEAHEGGHDAVPDLEDDSDPSAGDCLRIRLATPQARAFAQRAARVVAAGRPPCPFCHLPLDPSGHICPRANGYRR